MVLSYPDTVQRHFDLLPQEIAYLEDFCRKLASLYNELELTGAKEFMVNETTYTRKDFSMLYNMLDDFVHGPIIIE